MSPAPPLKIKFKSVSLWSFVTWNFYIDAKMHVQKNFHRFYRYTYIQHIKNKTNIQLAFANRFLPKPVLLFLFYFSQCQLMSHWKFDDDHDDDDWWGESGKYVRKVNSHWDVLPSLSLIISSVVWIMKSLGTLLTYELPHTDTHKVSLSRSPTLLFPNIFGRCLQKKWHHLQGVYFFLIPLF